MGIKVQQKFQTITPFGGISFINDEFRRSGLSALIDKELGRRSILGYRENCARMYPDVSFATFFRFGCR
jgi:hypothetical protein